jgi:3-dehydroquinate synthase
MSVLNITLSHASYPIYVESGVLDQVGALCRKHAGAAQVCIITDDNVGPLYLEQVSRLMTDAGYQVLSIVLPAGEQTKATRVCDDIYTKLIEAHFERSSIIVALGGGVIGDLSGFIAATYLRGVRFVQVPTTLLAQTDSSVGGKVGVNHPLGKNLIGAFYHPECVVIDPLVLKTLPAREMSAGMGEVVKYGPIWDEEFFGFVESRLEDLLTLTNLTDVEHIVYRSCEIKAHVVDEDEKEGGLRKILNYGHTFGHAIEYVTGFNTFLHGEGVVLGMEAALLMSERIAGLPAEQSRRAEQLFRRLPMPHVAGAIDTAAVSNAMRRDKKVEGGKVKFVLIERLGKAVVHAVADTALWAESIDYGLRRIRNAAAASGGTES